MLGLTKAVTRLGGIGRVARSLTKVPVRWLHLHEYQAAQILKQYGLPVLRGKAAFTADEAFKVAEELQDSHDVDLVMKAQIHAGGRGLGHFLESKLQGGVHMVSSPQECREKAKQMLGNHLVTKQSGPAGKPCNAVYIVERIFMRRELYLAIFLDRTANPPSAVLLASEKGGVTIEESDKGAIFRLPISVDTGLTTDQATEAAKRLKVGDDNLQVCVEYIMNLYKCFKKSQATLIELNPFAFTSENKLLVADCKINIDENAHFRVPKLFEMEDKSQKDRREIEAEKSDLNFIALDGNIGCLVNGAGLAMATMDLIKNAGGEPANFLDIGGKASDKEVYEALRILNDDPKVEAILVNIFAGIARCDHVAMGLIKAMATLGMKTPVVLRLKGTKVQEAKELVEHSGFNLFLTEELELAAERAVKMSMIMRMARDAKLNIHLVS